MKLILYKTVNNNSIRFFVTTITGNKISFFFMSLPATSGIRGYSTSGSIIIKRVGRISFIPWDFPERKVFPSAGFDPALLGTGELQYTTLQLSCLSSPQNIHLSQIYQNSKDCWLTLHFPINIQTTRSYSKQ